MAEVGLKVDARERLGLGPYDDLPQAEVAAVHAAMRAHFPDWEPGPGPGAAPADPAPDDDGGEIVDGANLSGLAAAGDGQPSTAKPSTAKPLKA